MMMNNKPTSECDLCLDVLSGVCTDEERIAFEHHLLTCSACQTERNELLLTWGALYANMEPKEPPMDLKQQVMDAAFAADEDLDVPHEKVIPNNRRFRTRRSRMFTASVSMILIFFIAGSVWNVWLYQERSRGPLPIEEALSVSAAQISQVMMLKAQSPSEDEAYGIACVVDNGQSKQFVLYVYGASETNGNQAYQVWLIKDGVRRSAGTFRVSEDSKGVGVLAMPIQSDTLDFDKIGITLEPDDNGDQPRGQKMFGSV
ncbi:MAG: anti-sigma factor [Paenibacillus sp.]|nr:anti-sigma factor [Paenibacillus sp.]